MFYSDLHLRPERLADCETVLSAVGALAKKHGAVIVNGGDTFNTRGLIRTSCFDLLNSHYQKWKKSGLRQVILVGNHDQEDKAGEIHPMRTFDGDGWIIADKPVINTELGFAFFPYMEKERIRDFIASANKLKIKRAVVHWGIRGAKRNDYNTDTDGIPLEWLSCFDVVFSGHYHYRSILENVHYIGSPMQQTQQERDQAKGCLLYDDADGSIEFIPIKGTSKHHRIEIRFDGKAKPLPKIAKGDFVCAQVIGSAEECSTVSRADFDKLCDNVTIERVISEKSFSRLSIDISDKENESGLAKKYVDFVETPLDKKRLMDTYKELVGYAIT